MPKANRWDNTVPRAELDHKAREARLGLERIERLLPARQAANPSWLRRVISRSRFDMFGECSRDDRARGPLSNQRPRRPQIRQVWPECAVGVCADSGLSLQPISRR
jgi:hypothetical protein